MWSRGAALGRPICKENRHGMPRCTLTEGYFGPQQSPGRNCCVLIVQTHVAEEKYKGGFFAYWNSKTSVLVWPVSLEMPYC